MSFTFNSVAETPSGSGVLEIVYHCIGESSAHPYFCIKDASGRILFVDTSIDVHTGTHGTTVDMLGLGLVPGIVYTMGLTDNASPPAFGGTTTHLLAWTADLVRTITNGMANAMDQADPATSMALYSVNTGGTAGTYTRNPDFFLPNVDLTCRSAWSDFGAGGTTLIDPSYSRVALHVVYGGYATTPGDFDGSTLVGKQMVYVGTDNSVQVATVASATLVTHPSLDSSLTALYEDTVILQHNTLTGIKPAKLLPANWRKWIPRIIDQNANNLISVEFNQFQQAGAMAVSQYTFQSNPELNTSAQIIHNYIPTSLLTQQLGKDYGAFSFKVISGDSSSPAGLVIGEDFVEYGGWSSAFDAVGIGAGGICSFPSCVLIDLETSVAGMSGPTFNPTLVDLSAFVPLSPLVNIPAMVPTGSLVYSLNIFSVGTQSGDTYVTMTAALTDFTSGKFAPARDAVCFVRGGAWSATGISDSTLGPNSSTLTVLPFPSNSASAATTLSLADTAGHSILTTVGTGIAIKDAGGGLSTEGIMRIEFDAIQLGAKTGNGILWAPGTIGLSGSAFESLAFKNCKLGKSTAANKTLFSAVVTGNGSVTLQNVVAHDYTAYTTTFHPIALSTLGAHSGGNIVVENVTGLATGYSQGGLITITALGSGSSVTMTNVLAVGTVSGFTGISVTGTAGAFGSISLVGLRSGALAGYATAGTDLVTGVIGAQVFGSPTLSLRILDNASTQVSATTSTLTADISGHDIPGLNSSGVLTIWAGAENWFVEALAVSLAPDPADPTALLLTTSYSSVQFGDAASFSYVLTINGVPSAPATANGATLSVSIAGGAGKSVSVTVSAFDGADGAGNLLAEGGASHFSAEQINVWYTGYGLPMMGDIRRRAGQIKQERGER